MAATDPSRALAGIRARSALAAALLLIVSPLEGAVLPEDRADVMYHGYDGGGLKVDGPSVLVRKAYKDKISVWANYYVDMISSASIDVVATASEYTETRKEMSIGADYLHGKTTMGVGYINSEEDDYSASAVSFGISQDFFGDLTTLGIGYSRGWDEVRRNGDETFAEDAKRQSFSVDLSQVVTRNLLVSLNYEGVTDEGFLNNPYRQVRYRDAGAARGFSYQAELYPRTRTSSATAVRAMYYLPYRASLKGEYRYYTDTWGIGAWNAEIGYVHPLPKGFTLDLKYRFYDQSAADFYADLFDRQDAQNFMARDKELASYTTHTVGIGVGYAFATGWMPLFERGEANLFLDWIRFDYDDFRDVTVGDAAPGEEPLYGFDSMVIRAYLSFWF